MLNTNTQMGLIGSKLAEQIVDKYAAFSALRRLKSFRGTISRFLDRQNLVYAFPLILIRRNVLLSKKTRTVLLTKNVPILTKSFFEKRISPNLYLFSSSNKLPMMTFLTWNKLALENVRESREQALRLKQETVVLHQTEANPQISSLSTHVFTSPFFATYRFGLALHSRELSREETVLSHTRLSKEKIIEKQIKWFPEKILQRDQRMVFLDQQRPFQHVKQGRLQLLNSRGVLAERGSETPFNTTQGNPSLSVHEYVPQQYVVRAYPQIIRETKEKIVEKESIPAKQAKSLAFDMNRLADQICQFIERKVRIERERRGL
jgi:hypothetical protein